MLREDSPFHIRLRADPGLAVWLVRFLLACTRARSRTAARAIAALSSLSLDLFEELRAASTVEFFYERRGGLTVFLTEEGFAAAHHEAEEMRGLGLPVEVWSRAEAREREPALGPGVMGGLYLGGDAHGWSLGFAEGLAASLRADGVRIESGVRARSLVTGGGRVRGATIETGDGERREWGAEETVVALGAWSPAVAGTAGVRLGILPAKGYSATVRSFAGAPRIPVTVAERKVIITPFGDRVRLAGTLELNGFDRSLNEARYRAIMAGAEAALLRPIPRKDETPWVGFRPLTPTGLPFIGRPAGAPGLLVATGHGTLGFTQSLGTGRLIQEIADGAPPSLDPAPFQPPPARLPMPRFSGR